MYKQILSPVDGSPTSNGGMAEAIRLARDQKAKLRFLHVVDAFFATLDPSGAGNLAAFLDILRHSGEKILEDAKAAARAEGVEADALMVESSGGRVADLIASHARNWPADLIVMGTHGRRGVSHLFMGSDAESVVRTSPVPVLLVRSIEEASAEAR